jgi:Kdo2-lipid IVA lauroyltransferase/acyltransferase
MQTIKYYILLWTYLLVALIPFPILYFISDGIYYLVYYIFQYRKEVVFKNLQNSFPEKNAEEIKIIAKKFYRHFCDLFIETIKLIHLSPRQIEKRVKLRNPEILEDVYKHHKLIMVALGHYNNWEMISTLTKRPQFQIISIYKALNNKAFDRLMLRLRSQNGSILVSTTQTLRFLNSWKDNNTRAFFCFIADQSPLPRDIHYWTKFLNQETPIFTGLEKLALRLDVPVAFFHFYKTSRGHYELEISPITEKPSLTKHFEITEAHVRMLEYDIIKNPEYWLWSHRRWKRQPENINPSN